MQPADNGPCCWQSLPPSKVEMSLIAHLLSPCIIPPSHHSTIPPSSTSSSRFFGSWDMHMHAEHSIHSNYTACQRVFPSPACPPFSNTTNQRGIVDIKYIYSLTTCLTSRTLSCDRTFSRVPSKVPRCSIGPRRFARRNESTREENMKASGYASPKRRVKDVLCNVLWEAWATEVASCRAYIWDGRFSLEKSWKHGDVGRYRVEIK